MQLIEEQLFALLVKEFALGDAIGLEHLACDVGVVFAVLAFECLEILEFGKYALFPDSIVFIVEPLLQHALEHQLLEYAVLHRGALRGRNFSVELLRPPPLGVVPGFHSFLRGNGFAIHLGGVSACSAARVVP